MGRCLRPSCIEQDFSGLQGKTCLEATLEILRKYPGMTVLCRTNTATSLTDDDFNRYIVVTDSSGGEVLGVFFSRVPDCPASPTPLSFCESSGQKCNYISESGECEVTETCTCERNLWLCAASIVCPPVVDCPVEPPAFFRFARLQVRSATT